MNFQIILLLLTSFLFVFGRDRKLIVEQISGPYALAEGPHWDVEKQVLYFVDIFKQNVHCYNPKTKTTTYAHLSTGPVGAVVPVAGKPNTFIAASGTSLVEFEWNPQSNNLNPTEKVLSTIDTDRDNTRMNDGKVDPAGRFWVGTMGQKNGIIINGQGSLYRFSAHNTPTKMISPVSISNGLTWSLKNDIFYYIDSPTYEIVSYRYNNITGDIYDKQTVFNLEKNHITGIPDGMTISKNGNLWVAVYGGGKVIQIDPNSKKLLCSVNFGAKLTTSVAFGGPNLDILYVTSAREDNPDDIVTKERPDGYVFAVHNLNVQGTQMRSVNAN